MTEEDAGKKLVNAGCGLMGLGCAWMVGSVVLIVVVAIVISLAS